MTTITLDPQIQQILSDLHTKSLTEKCGVDAVSYRVENEDWIERLGELEQRLYIVRENDCYRVSFGALTFLDTEDASSELNQCEKIFDILRDHYKNPTTRKTSKRLIELATELGISYERIVRSILYFLDAAPFWSGGHSNNWEDRETANVHPSEEIIKIRSFSNLVSGVQRWFDVQPPLIGAADILASMLNAPTSAQEKRMELHPAPVVTSFLYGLRSDVITRIVGRVGLSIDWSLTLEEGYSDKTRLRVYKSRIETAMRALNENQRLLVTRNLIHELVSILRQSRRL